MAKTEKALKVWSNVKVLLTVFFDCKVMVHHEYWLVQIIKFNFERVQDKTLKLYFGGTKRITEKFEICRLSNKKNYFLQGFYLLL